MNARQRSGLAELIPGGVVFDHPMDKMTTYRIGGKAEAICYPGELNTLCRLIAFLSAQDIPYLVVGKGSNLLVSDKGIKGAVIVLRDKLASVEEMPTEGCVILAGGGLTIVELLSYCRNKALAGLEFLAGIPGTLGGAVFMNAGAFGNEIGDRVCEILTVGRHGEPEAITEKNLKFSYRSSSVPNGTVIYSAKFRLERGDKGLIEEMMAGNLKRKKASQPLEYPSAGSVFKNPPGNYAGKLIENAGLKGARIGGAMISPKHGNFIVNTGGAKAEDIKALIALARKKVKEQTGIDMDTEIVFIGD
jgi:UDP-N-acetylmuramate dehydrogenase